MCVTKILDHIRFWWWLSVVYLIGHVVIVSKEQLDRIPLGP